ncbi:molybdopterin-dependent oxidoreductase [Sphingomonas sp. DT-207]|uniref:molybdopterin-dependent oxidoreductase n=1 Tax=Sphingomonas sp. DT-207 TaxID=3396167 RepID=UPI003F1A7F4E
MITRRGLIVGGGAALLAGCDSLTDSPVLLSAEDAHRFLHRSITGRAALAREFRPEQRSPIFRTNGNANPNTPEYNALAANRFADWRLAVVGLVARPLRLSLAQLQAMPQRAQITRHDCVEGWSAIGKWQGPRLETLLRLAGIRDQARYIVFHCADRFGATPYYESIDLIDAFHPQTIMAWAMNDKLLSIGHGAPVRLRVERQLGYKHAKYVMRIEAVASLDAIGKGRGGFWEDFNNYEWYAGI